MYSIIDFIIHPFISLIFTVFLFFGFFCIGKILLSKLQITIFKNSHLILFQSSLIGIVFVGIIMHSIALIGLKSFSLIIKFIGFIILFVGIYHTKIIITNIFKLYSHVITTLNKENIFLFNLINLYLFFYFLFSLSPVTDADSLDYHIGYAIQILKSNGYIFIPEWFSSRLSGSGEILNALGISMSAIQLGSMIQFAAVLGVTGILLFINPSEFNLIRRENILFALLFLSSPILLSLINPKPQLIGIALNSFSIVLYLFIKNFNIESKEKLKLFCCICVLTLFSSQVKFSFLLSSFLIIIFTLYEMYKIDLFNKSIIFLFLFVAILITPSLIWKINYYDSNLIDVIFKITPDNFPGINMFNSYLKNYRDTNFIFPINLFVTDSLGTLTTIIGIGIIYSFVLVVTNLKTVHVFFIPILFVIFALFFGPKVSRYYLEPFIWLLILVLFYKLKSINVNFFNWMFNIQFIFTFVLIFYGIISLLPGSLSYTNFNEVMKKKANGYDALMWSNSILPKDAVVFYDGRSNALIPRTYFASDWLRFIDLKDQEHSIYYKLFIQKKVTHLLITGNPPHDIGYLSKHMGKKIAGPYISKISTRNPFNSGTEVQNWIYEFKY